MFPVLSTKILSENLIRSAFDEGVCIDCIPFIKTEYILDDNLQRKIETLSKQHTTAIFTSNIAVKAVTAMINQPPEWNIFSIQGQTKIAAEASFPQSKIIGIAPNGALLADSIIAAPAFKDSVFFCGNRRLDVLPAKLSDHNIHCTELVVYNTSLHPVKIKKDYKAVLFYSPSGVESFFSMNTITENILLFSIGDATTDAIQKHISHKVYTAATAEIPAMIKQVVQQLKQYK